jgi:hypothetical protein
MGRYGVDVFGSVYGPLTGWFEDVNEILVRKQFKELLQSLNIYYIFNKAMA